MKKMIKRLFILMILGVVAFSTTGLYFFRNSTAVAAPIRACVDGAEFLLGHSSAGTYNVKFYKVEIDGKMNQGPFFTKNYSLSGGKRC